MLGRVVRLAAMGVLAWFGAASAPAQAQGQANWTPVLDRKCTAGDAVACWQAGEALTAGRGVAPSPARASAAFAKACDKAIGEACYLAADARAKGADGKPGSDAEALQLYLKGCAASLGDACEVAAIWIDKGKGTTADLRQAMLVYDRACTLGKPRSCHYMSQLWGSGENPDRRTDGNKGFQYAASGCDWSWADSCVLAGYYAQGNYGVRNDPAVAERYARRGCELGHYGGCQNVGYFASQREDWVGAQKWYAKACEISGGAAVCKAKRDIDTYLVDKARHDAAWADWNRKQAEGAAVVGRFLAQGDYASAIEKASYDMGSAEQVSRVLVAAQDAGRLGDIRDIYFDSYGSNWQLTPRARSIVNAEKPKRVAAARMRSMVSYSAPSSGSSWSWRPSSASSSYSSSSPTYAAIPTISESSIYRAARESVSRSYCNAGWGCR